MSKNDAYGKFIRNKVAVWSPTTPVVESQKNRDVPHPQTGAQERLQIGIN
jgi:hypothetical protein